MLEQTRIMTGGTRSGQNSLARPIIGQREASWLLRISLSAVFFWFGILKVAGLSPVADMLRNSFAFLAAPPYLQLLGMGEIAIALGLLVPGFSRLAATLMVVHLLCTLSLVFTSPSLVFAPSFPVLTMEGEFLAKNLVLISAGLTVIVKKNC
jgi:uncharacterized membrane protein YkgB